MVVSNTFFYCSPRKLGFHDSHFDDCAYFSDGVGGEKPPTILENFQVSSASKRSKEA